MPAFDNPPPRPGFTRSLPQRNPPVVVALTESVASIAALRRAADEASHRSSPLHVIAGGVGGESLHPAKEEERESHMVSWILRLPNVTLSIVDQATPQTVTNYCSEVSAALLVIGCDRTASEDALESPATAHRLITEAGCDILVIHARAAPVGNPPVRSA